MNSSLDAMLNNETSRKKKNLEMAVRSLKSGETFPLILETQYSKKFVKDFREASAQIELCKSLKADSASAGQFSEALDKAVVLYKAFKANFIDKFNSKYVDAAVLYLNLNAMMKEFKEDKKAASAASDALE